MEPVHIEGTNSYKHSAPQELFCCENSRGYFSLKPPIDVKLRSMAKDPDPANGLHRSLVFLDNIFPDITAL